MRLEHRERLTITALNLPHVLSEHGPTMAHFIKQHSFMQENVRRGSDQEDVSDAKLPLFRQTMSKYAALRTED